MVKGRVNYLVRGASGEWWVTTRKNDEPYSGMPLNLFLLTAPAVASPEIKES